MTRRAPIDHPIHDLLAERWSPSGFSSRPVAGDDLRGLFEAARWAPSSYNEQPWRYLVARREDGDEFEKLLSCLVEANQAWARRAPVLGITVAKLEFSRNGRPNRVAVHDIGLASAQLTVEATARGLHVHQMAGILPDRVREVYEVPDGFEAVTGIAIGYLADPDDVPDDLRDRDSGPRTRRPLDELVFSGGWGRAASLE